MSRLYKQLLRFGLVGIICFAIDYVLLVFLTEIFAVHYLLSSGISFIVSTVINYILSMKYIFRSKDNIIKVFECFAFVLMSIGGLGITVLLMHISVDKLCVHYMMAKIIVTGIVMVYNFVTRKVFLDDSHR